MISRTSTGGACPRLLLAWPLVRQAARTDRSRRLTIELTSAVGVAAGTFWFLTRA